MFWKMRKWLKNTINALIFKKKLKTPLKHALKILKNRKNLFYYKNILNEKIITSYSSSSLIFFLPWKLFPKN